MINIDDVKILIVDDAGYIRVLFKEALKQEGYIIETAESALDAYEKIKTFEPNLILLDINLPGASGIEILKQIRKEGDYTPVIMITAVSLKDKVIEASKYGISGYLTKPVDINDLKSRIKKVLEERYSV